MIASKVFDLSDIRLLRPLISSSKENNNSPNLLDEIITLAQAVVDA